MGLPALPFTYFSPEVIFIPSDPPNDRHGILKPRRELESLPDNSTEVFQKGIFERYQNRPDSLANMCYTDYKTFYGTPGRKQLVNMRKIIDFERDSSVILYLS